MLSGYPPFIGDCEEKTIKIKKGNFEFNSEFWDQISDSAKDLISKLLVVDASIRLTAEQILNHEWMRGFNISSKPLLQKKKNSKIYLQNDSQKVKKSLLFN